MRSHFCIPRLGGGVCKTSKSKALPPAMTLLERVQEVLLRLIVFCALPKAADRPQPLQEQRYCYSKDDYNREAFADCIEFIKKNSSSIQESWDSSASSSMDDPLDMIILCQCQLSDA